ncbi:MAG: hypothetical protein JJE25_05450 [Bacteroidia bacterium]|nr:hypothetical protein [Bacteroidia bacterium]
MLKKIYFSFILSSASCFSGCFDGGKDVIPPRSVYEFPYDKLWAHRVNTAAEANELLKTFNGIELDVYYFDDAHKFEIEHDTAIRRPFESFLDSIDNPSQHYYWIDFKNLNKFDVQVSLNELKRLITKYHLEKRIIVESDKAEYLASFVCEEIYTCYWIDRIYTFIPYLAEYKHAKNIRAELAAYHFDALSCSYKMNGFFQRYFKNYNILLWTDELSEETDVNVIRKLAAFKNVKVILTDSRVNFLRMH